MGVYATVLTAGAYVAPIMFGFIAENLGFKWTFYTATIIAVVGLVIIFFFLEETNYARNAPMIISTPGAIKKETITAGLDVKKHDSARAASDSEDARQQNIAYTKKTYIQRLSLWNPTPGPSPITRIVRAFTYLSWPIIFYSGSVHTCARLHCHASTYTLPGLPTVSR